MNCRLIYEIVKRRTLRVILLPTTPATTMNLVLENVQELAGLSSAFPAARLPSMGQRPRLSENEIYVLTNGDLRRSANLACWNVQRRFEEKLSAVLRQRFSIRAVRAHPHKDDDGHGFIGMQREGSATFASIDPDAPLIVLLTAWQYSHHVAPSIVHHRGPVLVLANFDGTWPGLVGALNLCGTLTGLGRAHSRLWSENFDDEFFFRSLDEWLRTGLIPHDLSYLSVLPNDTPLLQTDAGRLGQFLGKWILRHKEIIGLFDSFCMGMINGVFPQKGTLRHRHAHGKSLAVHAGV